MLQFDFQITKEHAYSRYNRITVNLKEISVFLTLCLELDIKDSLSHTGSKIRI